MNMDHRDPATGQSREVLSEDDVKTASAFEERRVSQRRVSKKKFKGEERRVGEERRKA